MIPVVKIMVSSVPVTGVAQTNLGSYVDSTVTVGNQREFFIHFTGGLCGSPLIHTFFGIFVQNENVSKFLQGNLKISQKFIYSFKISQTLPKTISECLKIYPKFLQSSSKTTKISSKLFPSPFPSSILQNFPKIILHISL